jgi:hypothetical protein
MNGIRVWIFRTNSFAGTVMIEKCSPVSFEEYNPAKQNRAFIPQLKANGLTAAAIIGPFVEPAGWDQASASLKGFAEGRLFAGFELDVHEGRLSPSDGKSPPHYPGYDFAIFYQNDRSVLSRSDVETLHEI